MNSKFTTIVLSLSFFVLAPICLAQDPVVVNSNNYKLLFENEKVRLLEYKGIPGDLPVKHWHPGHLVYSLSDWEREFTNADGSTFKASAKSGDTFWAPAGVHSGRNIGKTPTHALIFELRSDTDEKAKK